MNNLFFTQRKCLFISLIICLIGSWYLWAHAQEIPVQYLSSPRRVTVEASPGKPYTGQLTGTAGTPVQLPAQPVSAITIKALAGNTGTVYLGGSGVTSSNGFPLAPGESLSTAIDDINRWYFVPDTTGDGVAWAAIGY